MSVANVHATRRVSDAVRGDLDRLKEVSGRIIGRMFYGTLLKAMRDSKLNTAIGHGGRGEAVFAEQLHGIYAERMGATARGGLKEVLYESLKRQQERISAGGRGG